MKQQGHTLPELVAGLVIAGILLGLAIPGFERFVLDSRLTTEINAFVGAVQRARSEAAKRARTVVLCKTADLEHCGGDEIGYDAGWMLFVDDDGEKPVRRAPDEPLILAHRPVFGGSITANRALFEFRPFRTRSTNGTVTFCDRRGAEAARAVIVSYTGRPRVARVGPGRPLTCPA